MKSIMLKIWLTIILINLMVFAVLGIALGKLVHDFHFNLKAEDLEMLGKEINVIYQASGKDAALSYSLAMARHSYAKIAIVDYNRNILVSTDKKSFANILSSKNFYNLKKQNHYINLFNQNMLLVVIPSNINNFSTIILTPIAPITSTINELWVLMFKIGIVMMLLLAAITYLISKRISSPLLILNKEALKIAEGNFDSIEVPQSNDEIGQLSNTIHYVAQSMKNTLTERERLYQIQKDFVANVSHDLRTPLSLIQGYAIALQQDIAQGKEKDNAIQVILDESERMHRLTNQLLDLAKLEAGKESFNFSTINISDVTRRILENYSTAAKAKGIAFVFQDLLELKQIQADEDRIAQVIINLLNNAINHTNSDGEITVTIMNNNNNQLLFKVHNTGSVIPQDELHYIWERFYKGDKSRHLSVKNTGLGLAIVKGIVNAHGGDVGVSSSDRDGTTFWFSLPTKKEPNN